MGNGASLWLNIGGDQWLPSQLTGHSVLLSIQRSHPALLIKVIALSNHSGIKTLTSLHMCIYSHVLMHSQHIRRTGYVHYIHSYIILHIDALMTLNPSMKDK